MYLHERFYEELPAMADAVAFDVTAAAQWFLVTTSGSTIRGRSMAG